MRGCDVSDFEYERLAWWILSAIALLVGYWRGYRAGWRDRWRNDVRTIKSVNGTTITVGPAESLRPGDHMRILR